MAWPPRALLVLTQKRKAYRRLLRPRWRTAKLAILRFFNWFIPSESQRVFALTLIVGAACGLTAVAFHLAIIWGEDLLIGPALASSNYLFLGVITPIAGGAICGVLLTYVAPGARGSGIPQVKVAYAVKGGRIPFREILGKFTIGVLQIGSGASLGREGPTVHICAGLASALGRTFALSQKNLKRMLPVGAAAGIAAAFNAPISAVTFTIEEIVGDLDQTVLSGVIVAAAIAAAIERSILGEHPVFTVTQTYGLHYASSLILYGFLGIAGGAASLVFTESLLKLRTKIRDFKLLPEWAQPAIGGAVTGLCAVAALYFVKTGGINGGGYDTLTAALSGSLAFKVMALLCVLKIGATVFSYSSGGAGGIFAPALFIGGMLGGMVGLLDVSMFGHPSSEVGAFALVGMGAVFAGIVRAPITSVLIIFEMTGSYGLILPLMIANMTSYGLARHFRPVPIYEALLVQDNVHLPDSKRSLAHALSDMRVADAFQRTAVVLDSMMTVGEAFDAIRDQEFTTFPIVTDSDRCVGVVTEMRLRRSVAEHLQDELLTAIADKVHYVHPDQPLSRAVLRMNSAHVRQLSVLARGEGRKFLGIITMSDIVRIQASVIDQGDITIVPGTMTNDM